MTAPTAEPDLDYRIKRAQRKAALANQRADNLANSLPAIFDRLRDERNAAERARRNLITTAKALTVAFDAEQAAATQEQLADAWQAGYLASQRDGPQVGMWHAEQRGTGYSRYTVPVMDTPTPNPYRQAKEDA